MKYDTMTSVAAWCWIIMDVRLQRTRLMTGVVPVILHLGLISSVGLSSAPHWSH